MLETVNAPKQKAIGSWVQSRSQNYGYLREGLTSSGAQELSAAGAVQRLLVEASADPPDRPLRKLQLLTAVSDAGEVCAVASHPPKLRLLRDETL